MVSTKSPAPRECWLLVVGGCTSLQAHVVEGGTDTGECLPSANRLHITALHCYRHDAVTHAMSHDVTGDDVVRYDVTAAGGTDSRQSPPKHQWQHALFIGCRSRLTPHYYASECLFTGHAHDYAMSANVTASTTLLASGHEMSSLGERESLTYVTSVGVAQPHTHNVGYRPLFILSHAHDVITAVTYHHNGGIDCYWRRS